MCGVGLHRRITQLLAAGVVKFVYQRGIFGETLRSGDLFDAMVVPQTVTGAEGLNARFGGNARAGEDDDVSGVDHGMRSAFFNVYVFD